MTQEARILHLLDCLQKTAPPVLIFAEKKQDVDAIHEYLLLKGVDAVAIHGGKDQEERLKSIESFRNKKKDVLVATDVASKGLDFQNIQHVINFDMPEDIENYGNFLTNRKQLFQSRTTNGVYLLCSFDEPNRKIIMVKVVPL